MKAKRNTQRKIRRAQRVRAKISGTAARPRLAVFRSNKFIYVQLIDDEHGKTLASVSSRELIKEKSKKTEKAREVGRRIAKKASTLGITGAVFDRRRYRYHGRVQAVAEGAREGGIKI